ncbi:MAG TPA: FtsX-like permease family protein [Blastocatellia bacterium]|nr:FtsX-like permease family protein [Blastocatellia bacterium]
MNFVLNMAWREMRASWHRLLFFFLCIAIGVGSIVSLRSLIQSIKVAVKREARLLIAADVAVSVTGPWKTESLAALERYFNSPLVLDHTEALDLGTLVRATADPNAVPRLVWLTAVQPQYPFYGEVRLAGGQRYDHSLLKDRGVLVRPKLLIQHNLKVGDEIKIGRLNFTIRGVIEKEPGQMAHFRPAPRVLVDYNDLLASGLTDFGARVNRKMLFKTREGQDQTLMRQLWRELRTHGRVEVQSFRSREGPLNEQLAQLENYLSLLGLVILALGGIGISSVTRVFIQQKMKTIAILKCLGGDNRRVLGLYLAQVLALGLLGGLLGLALAKATTIGLPKYLADRILFDIEYGVTRQAALQGLGAGVLVALLFSLPPLLEVRRVKPILVMRNETTESQKRVDWLRLSSGSLILLGLFALSAWQAGSFKIGGLFLAGLAGTTFILNLVGVALIRSLRQARRLPSFILRQGVNSLYRPGNQTRVILFAVGLGAFFVITVRLLQVNLVSEFNYNETLAMHDLGMIDIQKDQRAELEAMVSRLAGEAAVMIPILRMRVVSHGPQSWERTVTYRPNLAEYEKIIAGRFWEATPSPEPEISVTENFSSSYRLGVGDLVTLDLLGRKITAPITSIRRLDLRVWTPADEIVFRPGALEGAPQIFAARIKGPIPAGPRAQIMREVADRFPNVVVYDFVETFEAVRAVVHSISLVVTFVGGFVFLCGALILVGSIAMTKFHRLYEAAILKTLGAEKKLIVYITLIEYGVLGLLAGVIGSSAANGLTWAVSKYGMKIPWQLAPSVNLIGVAVTSLLVMAVGVLSSWDVMTKKPLGILRAE